ncbi:Monogalactosyldiacylglycerol (MGDG) synthase [Peptoclostridium litorale DSM 5388]|uniref:Putative glycosyl transferase n=1 Tax=Peptoclostridium litorale DSM 5388 TaxID=1121324 RepID=A0A069RR09_PEPLI|nr:hypothetical protein [Peptoclostridium litorale]KDR96597.1 putative glycosyl transferase [Peptoclostridium litorale DSM 5388]SIN68662.1 Monogalactosyldiacylglycerol (MGDG) synthase [Peptoclostridium litorale DSM 5388]
MKKILIFTASTGGGHNQVALTLEHELKTSGYDVTRIDILKEENKVMQLLIEDGYEILASKFPKIYGELYKQTNREEVSDPFMKFFIKAEYQNTKEIIKKYNPVLRILSTLLTWILFKKQGG